VVRIGYAGSNGWPYRSIGRALIDRSALQRGKASWDDIRGWIDANRDAASALLAVNRRYIFFREIEGDGPIGAAGIALTPGRSLAIDPRYMPFGVPVWLDTTWPDQPDKPLRRLMIAQDSGNAIRGVVRGDFFWGYGAEALAYAGRMKSRGRYFVLLPKSAAARRAGS
jgi:membrane-bound lytic murein transglycosylase A